MTLLADWQVFCEILGSAAGALTGLQFLVMALISDMPMRSGEDQASDAFASPTIVHFVAVLLLATSMAMPWHGLRWPGAGWTLLGVVGFIYTLVVIRRMRRQLSYHPVLEDWLFHAILPVVAYLSLTAAALRLAAHTRGALFGIAGAALLLLLTGIHNAWDNVLFLVSLKRERMSGRQPQGEK